ncbi:MAG: hypothetical protein QW393_01235 [Candidatus Micrarchaeaceae archaeon]
MESMQILLGEKNAVWQLMGAAGFCSEKEVWRKFSEQKEEEQYKRGSSEVLGLSRAESLRV